MRTVILTFDDAVASHFENVAPLLRELGFGATFFICRFGDEWRAKNERFLMTGEQIRQLGDAGFDIGNHTWSHPDLRNLSEPEIESEVERMNAFLAEHGVAAPVSFAYPGGPYAGNAVGVLKRHGFRCARSVRNAAFRPAQDDPMDLPAYSICGDDPAFFRQAVASAEEENPTILVFHGVPEYVHPWVHLEPARFREYMRYLKGNDFRVCSLRDWFLPERRA